MIKNGTAPLPTTPSHSDRSMGKTFGSTANIVASGNAISAFAKAALAAKAIHQDEEESALSFQVSEHISSHQPCQLNLVCICDR